MKILLHRLRLWIAIVGRINQGEYRTGPLLAWDIAGIIYPREVE